MFSRIKRAYLYKNSGPIWSVAIGIIFFILIPRLLVFPLSVIDWDESIYLLVARDIVHGVFPYNGVFDHKPAGLYFLFAAYLALFGENIFSIRLLALSAVTATAILLSYLARRVFCISNIGLFAISALYGLMTLQNGGLATNTEILVNFFLVLAIFFMAIGNLDQRVSIEFSMACGLSLGIAFQINYLTGILLIGFAAYFVIILWRLSNLRLCLTLFFINGLTIFIFFMLAVSIILLPLLIWGDLRNYFDLQIGFLSVYVGASPLSTIYTRLVGYIPWIAIALTFISFICVKKVIRPQLVDIDDRLSTYAVAWIIYTLSAFLAAIISAKYYGHYFLLLVPGLVMITAWMLTVYASTTFQKLFTVGWFIWIGLLYSLPATAPILRAGEKSFIRIFHGMPADDLADISQKMAQKLKFGDLIYVYNADIIIYFLTKSALPTRFPFPDHHLNNVYASSLGFNPYEEMKSILSKAPHYIIVGPKRVDNDEEASKLLFEQLSRYYVKTDFSYIKDLKRIEIYERLK